MKIRSKLVYGIAGLIAFLPLSILIVVQSIFALEASYDHKLVIDANKITIVEIIMYDSYNNIITDLLDATDEDGKPIVVSIVEATNTYALITFHGGKVDNQEVQILGIQFKLDDGTTTEVLSGTVYLQFKNVAMTNEDPNWARDVWLRDFIEDTVVLYKVHYEQPASSISFVWVKIITASIGTLFGLATVLLIILRKSTKALVKRYWRISVLVALFQGTLVLGLIAWIVTDMFQVFAAATLGWALFLGTEKLAKIKGYLETATTTGVLPDTLPEHALVGIKADVEAILAKYRK